MKLVITREVKDGKLLEFGRLASGNGTHLGFLLGPFNVTYRATVGEYLVTFDEGQQSLWVKSYEVNE